MPLAPALNEVFSGMFASIAKEQSDSFAQVSALPAVQTACEQVRGLDMRGFYYSFMYPLDQLLEGMLASAIPNSEDAHFIFKNSQFVDAHFRALIVKYEGNSCCADKTRTVIRALLEYLTTGKEIGFDRSQQYTFHLPKKVFASHQEILEYFKAIQRLFYGQSEAYLAVLLAISERQASAG